MTTFRDAAEKEFGWKPGSFGERLYLECLDPIPRLIARLCWPWRQRLFGSDLEAVKSVAELTTYNDVFDVAQGFSDAERQVGFLRRTCGVRPRGRRLLALARELLPGRRQRGANVETAYHPGATWRNAPKSPVAKPWVGTSPGQGTSPGVDPGEGKD